MLDGRCFPYKLLSRGREKEDYKDNSYYKTVILNFD